MSNKPIGLSYISRILISLSLALHLGQAAAQDDLRPALGQPLSDAEVEAWAVSIYPDGSGLPAGSGSAAAGGGLYQQHCAQCHGPGGVGLTAPALAGAEEPLTSRWPDQTIGSYWPYASTLFDFIRRAKPMAAPGSFGADQVYALCAYLLVLNRLLDETTPLDATALRALQMPNRGGFRAIDVP